MRIRFGLCALLLLLGLIGCDQVHQVGGQPRKKVYRKIVSLSPSTTEIVAMVEPKLLAGRTSACDYPENFMPQIPVVGDTKPKTEAIVAIKPDLILVDGDLYSEQEIQSLKQAVAGADVNVFSSTTVADYADWLTRFAVTVAAETNVAAYVDKVLASASKASGTAPTKKLKVLALSGEGAGPVYAVGKGSFLADVIKTCGGEVVGPEGARYQPMSPEAIVAAQPDLILVAGQADPVKADPRFATTPAVKNGRVYGLNPDVMLRRGSRVNKLIDGISQLILLTANGK